MLNPASARLYAARWALLSHEEKPAASALALTRALLLHLPLWLPRLVLSVFCGLLCPPLLTRTRLSTCWCTYRRRRAAWPVGGATVVRGTRTSLGRAVRTAHRGTSLRCPHLEAREITDGNVNYSFVVTDRRTGKKLFLKQAEAFLKWQVPLRSRTRTLAVVLALALILTLALALALALALTLALTLALALALT